MNSSTPSSGPDRCGKRVFLITLACLFALLCVLFYKVFHADYVIFSNDGPLSTGMAKYNRMPAGYFGNWQDHQWVGGEEVSASPNLSSLIADALTPVGFSKFAAPLALLFLGLAAACFFRQLKLAPIACIIGGIAATLNSSFFSAACWGVFPQAICFGAMFLAMAAVANHSPQRIWIRYALAGFAVGLGVMEGFDIGAIFSLVVAMFVVFNSWNTESPDAPAEKLGSGVFRAAVVAICAGLIAFHTIHVLVDTQIKGVVSAGQDEKTKEEAWSEKTRWSLPPVEFVQVFIPGVFGYRMDSPNGAAYWGSVGEDPAAPELKAKLSSNNPDVRSDAAANLKHMLLRFSGGGIYAGVLVVVLAFWAFLQSLRSRGSPFSLLQRRSIWFWSTLAFISVLLAFGRYVPVFYGLFYRIPYVSTIRNPAKFGHVFSMCLVILFAYGLHGLVHAYMQNVAAKTKTAATSFKAWLAAAPAFDRNWIYGSFAAVGAALLGCLIFASNKTSLVTYLGYIGFDNDSSSPANADAIATHSVLAVAWFALFLAMTAGLLLLIFRGNFAGARAKWGGVLLGLLLVVDLGRSVSNWVVFWNYPYKYASNSIVDFLAAKPYEHRSAVMHFPFPNPEWGLFQQLYGIEWTQQLYPYYNVQCLDLIMEPRETVDNNAYRKVISPGNPATLLRLWQLTNTRYLLGPAFLTQGDNRMDVDAVLNQQLDPVQRRFKIIKRFDIVPKGPNATALVDYTVAEKPDNDPGAALALFELADTLPRAKLYTHWQVNTNDDATLAKLVDPAFDPTQTVLVSNPVPGTPAADTNRTDAGAVTINPNYKSTRIELDANATAPSVLLLNDKYSPKWHVTVDGQPATLLRANFLMRGVYLPAGHHTVVLQFAINLTSFFISAGFVCVALALSAFLLFAPPPPPEPAPAPATPEPKRQKEAKAKI